MQNVMSSRERVSLALSHKEADRVPLDLGGSTTTGMHVDSVYLLRQALGLDPPGAPVENLLAMYETVREYGRYPV